MLSGVSPFQALDRDDIRADESDYVVQSMIIAAGPDHRHRVIKLIRGQVWTCELDGILGSQESS